MDFPPATLNGGAAALEEGPAESTDVGKKKKKQLQVRDCTSNPTPGCPIIISYQRLPKKSRGGGDHLTDGTLDAALEICRS